jgi:acyl-CoA thioester hydrolase
MTVTQFELEFTVRDYELDLQGIVNNAVYQHYLEHARHEYLYSIGLDFAKLHEEGKDLVVTRLEMDFKTPLKSRDKFKVVLSTRKEGHLRIVFEQCILRIPDEKIIVNAKVYGVCLLRGRPVKPEDVLDLSKFGI